MKKLLPILLTGLALTACNDPEIPKKKVLDPFAQITVHIRETLPTSRAGDTRRLSPREMLEKATHFQLYSPEMVRRGATEPGTRSIGDNEKDFNKVAFLWWGDDVIEKDTIVTYWRDAKDLVIIHSHETGRDTIGYIPQSVRTEAFERILEAEKRQDYEAIYKIFNEAFVGVPCTPEEYKELKAKGQG